MEVESYLDRDAELQCAAETGAWRIGVTEGSLVRYRSEAQGERSDYLDGGEYEEFDSIALNTIAGVKLEQLVVGEWQFLAIGAGLSAIGAILALKRDPVISLGLFGLSVIFGASAYGLHDDGSATLTVKTRRSGDEEDWHFEIGEIDSSHEELVATLTERMWTAKVS